MYSVAPAEMTFWRRKVFTQPATSVSCSTVYSLKRGIGKKAVTNPLTFRCKMQAVV